jgi:hypothetical protein
MREPPTKDFLKWHGTPYVRRVPKRKIPLRLSDQDATESRNGQSRQAVAAVHQTATESRSEGIEVQ